MMCTQDFTLDYAVEKLRESGGLRAVLFVDEENFTAVSCMAGYTYHKYCTEEFQRNPVNHLFEIGISAASALYPATSQAFGLSPTDYLGFVMSAELKPFPLFYDLLKHEILPQVAQNKDQITFSSPLRRNVRLCLCNNKLTSYDVQLSSLGGAKIYADLRFNFARVSRSTRKLIPTPQHFQERIAALNPDSFEEKIEIPEKPSIAEPLDSFEVTSMYIDGNNHTNSKAYMQFAWNTITSQLKSTDDGLMDNHYYDTKPLKKFYIMFRKESIIGDKLCGYVLNQIEDGNQTHICLIEKAADNRLCTVVKIQFESDSVSSLSSKV